MEIVENDKKIPISPFDEKPMVMNIEIYFSRKNNHKFLIERWEFKTLCNLNENRKYRHIFTLKKLSTFLRTVYTYTRVLPAFHLYSKKGFDYNLEYKIDYQLENQNISEEPGKNNLGSQLEFESKSKKFKNVLDLALGKVNLEISYLNKIDIMKFEEELLPKNKLQNLQLSVEYDSPKKHQRYLSERNVKNFDIYKQVDIKSIKESYFRLNEQNKNIIKEDSELDLKRINSKSLDKCAEKNERKNSKESTDSKESCNFITSTSTCFNNNINSSKTERINDIFTLSMKKEKYEIENLISKLESLSTLNTNNPIYTEDSISDDSDDFLL